MYLLSLLLRVRHLRQVARLHRSRDGLRLPHRRYRCLLS